MKLKSLWKNLIGLAVTLYATASYAGALSCQDLFLTSNLSGARFFETEFSRTPDDSVNGMVTNRVAITVPSILAAYKRGIFPWQVTPEHNGVWFNPPVRGVLFLDNAKWGFEDTSTLKDLYKAEAKGRYRVTFDTAFERVMRGCQNQQRAMRDPQTGKLTGELQGTWITDEFIRGYTAMHAAGFGHSVEVWEGDELVGGTYGVMVGGVFTGESMFHTKRNVAKLAFDHLKTYLKSRGVKWVDTQVAPYDSKSLTVKWGAYEVSREDYLRMIEEAQKENITWR